MDFTLSQRCTQWRAAIRSFVDEAVGRIYADIRAFRIYDGASEVHRMSIARSVARRARAELESAPA
jgi:acyl-CoA dehydrogenase